MTPRRLLRMGWSEIAGRSVQALAKQLDRRGIGLPRDSVHGLAGVLADHRDLAPIRTYLRVGDDAGAARLLHARFVDRAPSRFFAGATDHDTRDRLASRTPDAARAIVDAADSIVAGRFDLLGYKALAFGNPIDWHLDPVNGRQAPLVHWTEIDALDRMAVGDSKVIWELNRHQWLVRLGQAYRLTDDERYADTFAAAVTGWMAANPPRVGINWASSLEAALRIVSWSWAAMLFRDSRGLAPELFARMLGSIADHARHVERYLSHYYSPNTHLTGEALGLVYAGLVFPELAGARRWVRLGRHILLQELGRQVLSDGVHFERATCYQRYTAEIYLHFLLLAGRNGIALPAGVPERIERMVDVLLHLRQPDGSMPQIGDADGGTWLPLSPRRPDDLRGVFAVAAAVFGRADHAWAAGGRAPEAVWLCDPATVEMSDRLPARPPDTTAALFPDGGYVVTRSGWDRRAHQLTFDVGALGCPVSGGHGHADLLSVQCAAFGEPALVDPGTYCYTAEPEWRDFFRGTAAHSTVRVDALDQAIPRGPFAWHARPSARFLRWTTTGTLDVAEAEHGAYARLADPVTHRRRVLWIKPRYWVIVDDLDGAAAHAVELRFQLAPLGVDVDAAQWARVRGVEGSGLFIRAFSPAALTVDVISGATHPIGGWYSADYGQRQPAPALVYQTTSRLPLRIATLLFPAATPIAEPPAVVPIESEDGRLCALLFKDTGEMVSFEHGDERVTPCEPTHRAPVQHRSERRLSRRNDSLGEVSEGAVEAPSD